MTANKNILTIHSSIRNLSSVDTFLRGVIKESMLSESLYNRLYLCVSEAVVNAIVHGNNNVNEKIVTIEACIKNEHAIVKISDQGKGFNTSNLPDPTRFDNIKKESGRGLYIIKSFSEDVQFKEKGNIIEFKIKLCEKYTVSS